MHRIGSKPLKYMAACLFCFIIHQTATKVQFGHGTVWGIITGTPYTGTPTQGGAAQNGTDPSRNHTRTGAHAGNATGFPVNDTAKMGNQTHLMPTRNLGNNTNVNTNTNQSHSVNNETGVLNETKMLSVDVYLNNISAPMAQDIIMIQNEPREATLGDVDTANEKDVGASKAAATLNITKSVSENTRPNVTQPTVVSTMENVAKNVTKVQSRVSLHTSYTYIQRVNLHYLHRNVKMNTFNF